MENRCRACLTLSPKLQYYSLLTVFPEFARQSLSVLDLLSIVTSTKVNLSSNCPSKICSECFKSLKLAYSFIVAFQNSQTILLENVKQSEKFSIVTQDKNLEETLDSNEENIIIITEEEYENDILEPIENISNIDDIMDFKLVKIESTKAENDMIDIPRSDLFEDDFGEFDLSEDDNFEEEDLNSEVNSEDMEEEVIFDTDVDQQIIKMEETILEESKSKIWQLSKCQFCDKAYTAHRNLLAHMRNKHPEHSVENRIKVKEEKTKTDDPLEIYKCEICDKVFRSKSYFQVHKHNFHHPDGNQIYKCDICNEVFQNKCAARYHKVAVHKGKNFSCSICKKKFISQSALKQHTIAVHEKRQPDKYLCSICGRGFKYSTALKYHMGKQHTNQRDFVCGYCGIAFILLGELRSHERNHTGERPHSCKHCEKTFKRSSERSKHEKTHLGIYPHKCEYCSVKEFTSSYNMRVHWLQHRGDYKCKVCHKGFAAEEILRFHYSRQHKLKDVILKEEQIEED